MLDYVRRLVIEPWADAINIVKKAARYNAKVLEIRRAPDQEQFPTLMKFRNRVGDLPNIPQSWQEPLKEAKGIYLLTFPPDGQHYVGSASGERRILATLERLCSDWQRRQSCSNPGEAGRQERDSVNT